MTSVFVSSLARGEMGDVRGAAREAVESLGMRPVMFETEPAADESSRRYLLDRLAHCDVVLLLLGREYGDPGARGLSPTEEEFTEARERGIEVLPLVQRGASREPAQEQFVRRVRGAWEAGTFAPEFSGPFDVGMAVVRTLNAWRERPSDSAALCAARDRALNLARGDERANRGGGSKLRVVAAPVTDRVLLDAVALADESLSDDLCDAARASRLIPHVMGITPSIGRNQIDFALTGGPGFETVTLCVGFDGAVLGEGAVGGGDRGFGGMIVLADRARAVVERALTFAENVWRRSDVRDEIRQVAVAVAVPDAQQKIYSLDAAGTSMSMSSGMPAILLAPELPLIVRRADLGTGETIDRLQAELRRAFDVHGAVRPARGN